MPATNPDGLSADAAADVEVELRVLWLTVRLLESVRGGVGRMHKCLTDLREVLPLARAHCDPEFCARLEAICTTAVRLRSLKAELERERFGDFVEGRVLQQHDVLERWLLDQLPDLRVRYRQCLASESDRKKGRSPRL